MLLYGPVVTLTTLKKKQTHCVTIINGEIESFIWLGRGGRRVLSVLSDRNAFGVIKLRFFSNSGLSNDCRLITACILHFALQ